MPFWLKFAKISRFVYLKMAEDNQTTANQNTAQSADDESVDGLKKKIAGVKEEVQLAKRVERSMLEVEEEDERGDEKNELSELEQEMDKAAADVPKTKNKN